MSSLEFARADLYLFSASLVFIRLMMYNKPTQGHDLTQKQKAVAPPGGNKGYIATEKIPLHHTPSVDRWTKTRTLCTTEFFF